MSAVKNVGRGSPFHNGSLGVAREPSTPKWERTPWWMFWRPRWRRHAPDWWSTDRHEYRSERQLAHAFLEKQFSNAKPFDQKHQVIESRSWTGRPK